MSTGARDPGHLARRIARALGDETLVTKLAALSASELTSLLLEVSRERARRRSPAELLAQYARGDALAPSPVDPRVLIAVEAAAYAAAPDFEAIGLAPVSPLGLNQVLGEIDQNSVLSATRNLEIIGDPTTQMALEIAQRRRAARDTEVRLCAIATLMRMQPLPHPSFTRHFRILALASGGRDRGSFAFERDALISHARAHLTLLTRLHAGDYQFDDMRLEVSDTEPAGDGARRLAVVESDVFPAITREFPHVTCALDPARTHAMEYYRGLCFHVIARTPAGAAIPLGDGGSTDWTQRLLTDAKERMFVSGLGTGLMPRVYCRTDVSSPGKKPA